MGFQCTLFALIHVADLALGSPSAPAFCEEEESSFPWSDSAYESLGRLQDFVISATNIYYAFLYLQGSYISGSGKRTRLQWISILIYTACDKLWQWERSACAADEKITDIDQCCETLAQLTIDQREQSMAREFFHWDQKAGEYDKEYAISLQRLAQRALRGSPPNRVTHWVIVQFRAGVRPPIIAAKLHDVIT
ncbi:hypothetical protein TSMEX_006077 [Taenia solium]|eukprot:TsM_001029000 transcript=TsM_001029000 gene=TsM_001029000